MPINTMKDDFLWGVATASYQVEGAVKEDGRGPSIWDTFSHTDGNVMYDHNGDISCDQYHKYPQDIKLMKELGVKSYRFSIAWPRIFPKSMKEINKKGFEYYHKLIDELKKNGIEPSITLYHWDLPQYLEDEGGWTNRQTAYHFQEYAKACFDEFKDKVFMWITLNEPWCSAFLGYENGYHAPGIKDINKAIKAVHHLNLAHGLALSSFRNGGYKGKIGITLNLMGVKNATNDEKDFLAADRVRDKGSRLFISPIFKGEYPKRYLDTFSLKVPVENGDMQIINQKIDFLGINYYSEMTVKYDKNQPEEFSEVFVSDTFHKFFASQWQDQPLGLYRLLHWVKSECGDLPLYITENGYGTNDEDYLSENDSRCHDPHRVKNIYGHIKAVKKAIDDGVNVKGHFVWSFIDNFEWAWGYTMRFGIIYCDYQDQRRIPKDSYFFYRDLIAGHIDLS